MRKASRKQQTLAPAPDEPPPLDRIDRNILRALQDDAAITNAALSERVNLSPTATLRRVEKLRETGVIQRTVAVLDPARIDMTTLVIVGVVLDRSTPSDFGAFEAAAKEIPGCLECHLVAGEFDYFLVLRTRDIAHFNRLHADAVIRLPGVRQIRTFFVLKEILSTTALPV
ncbi:MAG: Lrp/AsnC family transcriptional regulator [Rhizobiales bacterium]|nr:Lrp/AsnC family transcriptional regulator [Hyphomicrobiales bacterium]